ncbi:glycosyl transferase [Spiribacter salilacus]|uniref:glycosyl transferase n=1 Tax=Spiribacter salilacus TaxID=2664894 RepID=UPI001C12AC51|nr:glycosyl transferase [Spiribacter salilacus]
MAEGHIGLIWLAPALWVAVGITAVLVGVVRRYATSRQMLDQPGARRSHTEPTPRGGGLAIVAIVLLGLPLLLLGGYLPLKPGIGLMAAGLIVAAAGWWDDRMGDIPARWRLVAHALAAAIVLFTLGGLPPIPIAGQLVDFGLIGHALAWVYLIWMLNLFNFMDGINGIAGIEAFTVAGGLALMALMLGPYPAVVALGGLIAAGALGFLPWNFPTARIFMGDAGSGLLGLLLGALVLLAAHAAPLLFWSGIVLSAIFWIDATATLLVRTARRERITEAHRSHAYQHAAAKWGHTRVTLLVLLINLVFLLPAAWLLAAGAIPALPTVILITGLLTLLAVCGRAGQSC